MPQIFISTERLQSAPPVLPGEVAAPGADPKKVQSILRTSRNLCVEIGTGIGTFLTAKARLFPDHKFIGTDINERCCPFERLNRAAPDNLLFVRAPLTLLEALPRASVRCFYFLNPYVGVLRDALSRFGEALDTAMSPEGIILVRPEGDVASLRKYPELDHNPRFRFQQCLLRQGDPRRIWDVNGSACDSAAGNQQSYLIGLKALRGGAG